jgi:TRAP-type mannitol/chloroaromatic compound transport system permease large subunit
LKVETQTRTCRWLPLTAALIVLAGVAAPLNPTGGLAQIAKESRLALVIGNSRYDSVALANPENDANAMARTLKSLGFDVEKLTNATRTEMERAIIRFGRRLRKSRAIGLFYYAGHAVQVGGRNYLIPLGNSIETVEEIRVESVDLEYVLARMDAAANPLNVVILDACRDNPFGFSTLNVSTGLASVDAPMGTIIAYATAPGKVAADGEGGNGLYTGQLIQAMELPGTKIEDAFKQVRREVAKQTNGLQVPWESSSLTRDFYFKPAETASSQAPPGQLTEADVTFWESIRESTNPAMFKAYLWRYGTFSGLAEAKLVELMAAKAASPAPPAMVFDLVPMDENMVAVKTANIRSQPSINSGKVGTMLLGTSVAVTGKALVGEKTWYRVDRPGGRSAFVYGPLLGKKQGIQRFLPKMGPEVLALLMVAVALGFLFLGFPAAFTFGATAFAFALAGVALDLFDPRLLNNISSRYFGIMINDILVAVPLFVFMGAMLARAKLGKQLVESLEFRFGHFRGGLALSAVFVGMLLAATTGIVGPTVATMGLLFLPFMLRAGYSPRLATGTIVASASLGQIIPPSIILVLLGDILENANTDAQRLAGDWAAEPVSVADLFAGAVLPGLLLAGLYLGWIIIKALADPRSCPPVAAGRTTEVSPWRLFAQMLLPPLVLVFAVLGSILAGIATPTEAAGLGAAGAILLAGRPAKSVRKALRSNPPVQKPIRQAQQAEEIKIETLLEGVIGLLPRWSRGRKPRAKATTVAGKLIPAPPAGFELRGELPAFAAGFSLLGLFVLATVFDTRLPQGIVPSLELAVFAMACLLTAVFVYGLAVCLRRLLVNGALVEAMRATVSVSSMVFVTFLGATVFVLVFRGFNGDDLVTRLFAGLPGGAFGAMLVVMAVMFFLGLFLDSMAMIFLFVPIVAPVLLQMDISPIWFGVMIAITLQTSVFTPPLGAALNYLRGVAPLSVGTKDIYRGILPFVFLQLIGLLLIAAFPELATWLPAALPN